MLRKGVSVTIASDAQCIGHLDYGYSDTVAMLKNIGYKTVVGNLQICGCNISFN